MEINAVNVSDALSQALFKVGIHGSEEPSRNGPVVVYREPVLTTYARPTERVLFCPLRNANPFFHLMESLWMLAGRNDLAFPLMFNSRFKEYSDDNETIAGAYGFRWRRYFGRDQLTLAISELRRDPTTRRVVITMWSQNDLGGTGKDLPCNTHIYVDRRNGVLNMTVCCRSNDILWGAYGANAVHFSVLQEYLATAVGVPIGEYRQFSNNLHLYTDILPLTGIPKMIVSLRKTENYKTGNVKPMLLVNTDMETWNADLNKFMLGPDRTYQDIFFTGVARVMYLAWQARSSPVAAISCAEEIKASDWRLACVEWLQRYAERKKK